MYYMHAFSVHECSKLTDSEFYVLASDSYQGQKIFFFVQMDMD